MPWRKLGHRHERLRVARLFLELGRVMHESIYGDSRPFGSCADGIMVCVCVAIGHGENRMMNATKLSHYLEMPRTTVLRKLDELMELGVVERTGAYYHISPSRYEITQYLDRCISLIDAASRQPVHLRETSEMDA